MSWALPDDDAAVVDPGSERVCFARAAAGNRKPAMTDPLPHRDLTEADWTLIEALLPTLPGSPVGHDLRLVINGIFFLMRSGSGVRTVPPWSMAESYYWLWQADGTWSKIMAALHGTRPTIGLSPDTPLPQEG
jgi:Putative transposase of IS4/5 family (DUF4096)